MNILHIIYTNAVAGAEKYLLNLLPGLKKFNIECHLICVCSEESKKALKTYAEDMRNSGIQTSVLTGSKINFIKIAGSINSYLNKENISVIHSHLSNADLIAVLVKVLYNKKITIISSKHGYDEKYLIKYNADAKRHKIDRNLYYYYTRWLLSHIDINLGTSKAISDLYVNIKLAKNTYPFIHHGIKKIDVNTNIEKRETFTIKLIIVGRLEKVKGHKYLLEALAHVIKNTVDVTLLILGDGSEKNNLVNDVNKLGLEKHVSFLSFRENPYTLISGCDIIIQPSSFESFGLVYLEAFALKVPVVAFDVPAANEIIINNETGILVEKFNATALAEAISFLIKNPAERIRISANAYQVSLQQYTADKMIENTANWYRSLSL